MPTLDWIGKSKVVNHHLDVPYKTLERQYSFDKDGEHKEDNGSENMIIHGDNLEALKSLLPQYEGRIKCIYIDPPYNTGNEKWVYNDNVNDPKIRKWLGTVVGQEGEDLSRHDKWLCMMYPRLKLLHRLMSKDGVIFISIDDNELYNLKMICDEIFGANCFVNNISWQRTYSTRNDSKGIVNEVEHILCYSNQPDWQPNKLPRTADMDDRYSAPDGDHKVWKSGDASAPGASTHPGMVYAIQHPITGAYLYPPNGRCWTFGQEQMFSIMSEWAEYTLQPLDDYDKRVSICGQSKTVPDTINSIVLKKPFEEVKSDNIKRYEAGKWPLLYFTNKGKGGIACKRYLEEMGGRVATNLWQYSEVGHTDEASKVLKAIFGGKATFDTPKPARLIERVLQIATDKESIILDSFQELKTAALKKEFDVLLVFMFDRLGRIDNETPFVVEWFIKNGIEVWSVNEGEQRMDSHVDKLMNYIRFWQANGESEKTSLRVKTRLQQLVEEGYYTGGCAPFGYRLVNSGIVNKKGKELLKLEQDPSEVDIVRTIFEKSVKDGLGSYKMAEYINERKILTHNGSKFQSNTIKRILSNEIYCGFYVRGGVRSRRIEELRIIDDQTYARAQEILKQRKYKQDKKTQISKKAKSSTLLGGNIYCAHCGQRLCANSYMDRYKTKDGKIHESVRRYRYLCAGAAMNRNECDGQTVYTAQKVDSVVIQVLHECFKKIKVTPKDAAIEKRYKAQITELKREIKKLEKENESLKRKLRELSAEIANALLGDSKFTEDALALAITTTKDKIVDRTALIEEKKNHLDNKEAEMVKLDYYYEQFVSWADEFDNASAERKRMILCTLFKRITVGKDYRIEVLLDNSYEQFIA